MIWQGKIDFARPITIAGKPHGVEHEPTLLSWVLADIGRVVHSEDTNKLWFGSDNGWLELTPGGVGSHDHNTLYYTQTQVDDMFDGKNGQKQKINWINITNQPNVFPPEVHTHSEYLKPIDIDFALIATNGLVGTGANQVAGGNHTHLDYAPLVHTHPEYLKPIDVDFTLLTTNGLVGKNAGQVAEGDHVHTEYSLITHAHSDYTTLPEVQADFAALIHTHTGGQVSYDATASGLVATTIQGAVDALNTKVNGLVMQMVTTTPTDTPAIGTMRFQITDNILCIYTTNGWVFAPTSPV